MHLAAHITCPTIPQGWKSGEENLKEAAADLSLLQICISNSTPLSPSDFPFSGYFSPLKTSPGSLISMKCSLERVNFILLNVFVLDKHLGIVICLAEFLFPLDTGQYPASPFL